MPGTERSPKRSSDHRSRSAKRPSDNYENAEEISNSTDPEGGNEGTIKGRRARKPLKGVENGAFQQETNPGPKQSESELYFGDVSSCCGPESSFYDLAVDKEGTAEVHHPSATRTRPYVKTLRREFSHRSPDDVQDESSSFLVYPPYILRYFYNRY